MLRTALISDRRFLKHFAGRSHPERPERAAVMIEMAEQLHRAGILALSPREASSAELELCHDPAYVGEVRRSASMPRYDFDPDTHASPDSYQTALLAAGGVLTAVEAVMDGAADNAFAIVRPPGHHALATRAMGFCLFNNVAVAAALAIQELGVQRVFILDWDVHHGNGTAEIFRHRGDVLFASIHQGGLYPGTGPLGDVGSGEGEGHTINLPVPAGSDGDLWLSLLEHVVLPAAVAFAPQLVLISAGFDAHREDPLAGCRLETESFAEMARHVREAAAQLGGVPVGAVLEGGYEPGLLGECVQATMMALGGEGKPTVAAPKGPLTARAAAQIGRYWPL